MLTVLPNVIPYSYQLLLPLVVFFLCYVIQKIKRTWFPFLEKKQEQLAPCITPLEEAKEIVTDIEVTEEQKLLCTLETLDKSIHYLARQMKHVNGSISYNASSSSQESMSSVHSWTCTSARDTHFSRSETSLTPTPAFQKGKDQKWPLSLVRSAGKGFQQSHQESRSHHKVDVSMCQKQIQEKEKTPISKTLAKLIPTSLSLYPANKGTNVHKKSDRLNFLDYKDQELLNWHIHRKYQSKEDAPLPLASGVIIGREIRALTGAVGPPLGGNLPKGCQQPPLSLKPHSHTPPQVVIQGCHTPPKAQTPPKAHTPPRPPPIVESPGPVAWPPLPAPEDLIPPPMLICKTESHTSIRSLTESKGAGGVLKEDLTKLISLLGSSKNPKLKESGRPGTPKEKEKVCGIPNIPKEGHSNVGKPNNTKVKQEDDEISPTIDRKIRKLCWADIKAEALGKSKDCEEPSAACPKFLDSLFMCQNQLELPCIAAAQMELQPQENHPFPKPSHLGDLKPLCLAHTIVESLDMKQAMQDLQVCLAKGLKKGCSQPGVEYPICLLCGRCTPYCPHPRPQHSPCLLVYPRLGVQDGEVYMTLGFLLKIKRSEADAWGLVQGLEKSTAEWGREHPSRKERSKSRRRGRGKRNRSRGSDKAGECVLEEPDLMMRSRGTFEEDIESTTAPTSPQPYKRRHRRSHRKRLPLVPDEEEDLCPQKLFAMLKKLTKCLKKAWAKVRGTEKKTHLRRGALTFLNKPQHRSPSPEGREDILSIVSPEVPKKRGVLLNHKKSFLDLTTKKSPKRRTPKDHHETTPFKKGSRRSRSRRRRAGHRLTEPQSPQVRKREK